MCNITAARKCPVKKFLYRPDDIIIRLDNILIRPDELLYRPDGIKEIHMAFTGRRTI